MRPSSPGERPPGATARLAGALAGALALRAAMAASRRAGLTTTDLARALAPGRRRLGIAAQLGVAAAGLVPVAARRVPGALLYGVGLGAVSALLVRRRDAGRRPTLALAGAHAIAAVTASVAGRWASARLSARSRVAS